MTFFFSRLSYSFGNEDWRTEKRALGIRPHDQVLCITASGDRPLNLLARECQKIVCIDANPSQNYLLQLKMAAMQVLEFQEYLSFLGAIPGKDRRQTLLKLLPFMEKEAAQFWLHHQTMIEKGVLYQGAVERLTKIVARLTSFLRGKKLRKLFAMNNLEEQKKFVREEWDGYLWRKIFDIFLNPFISRVFLEDPGLENVGAVIKPGTYIYDRIKASLERDLARKNPLLSLLLKGKVYPEAFSPHLREEGTKVIKTRLQKLEVKTNDVVDYLDSVPSGTFDVFSLSDVASYMNYSRFDRLLRNIIRTAKPGARFCLRQFLSSYEIPADLQPFFDRNTSLEKQLEEQDNCFVYRFWTGKVVTAPSIVPTFSFAERDERKEEANELVIVN